VGKIQSFNEHVLLWVLEYVGTKDILFLDVFTAVICEAIYNR
jgi:hypothetical protein